MSEPQDIRSICKNMVLPYKRAINNWNVKCQMLKKKLFTKAQNTKYIAINTTKAVQNKYMENYTLDEINQIKFI